MASSRRSSPVAPLLALLALVMWPANSPAYVASALVREGEAPAGAPAGHVVNSLNNPAANHAGGYAVALNTTDGTTTLSHIWGNAAGGPGTILRTEGTFGTLVQGAFESFYGMSDAGNLAYSATGTGGPVGSFDSVWLDDLPVAVEGDPVPTLPGEFWVFASRPGVTADGDPYWASGFGSTAGGSSQNRGLFYGAGATPVLLGGSAVPGLPLPLVTSGFSFSYRYSAHGAHYITPVSMTGSTTADGSMVLDGQGLMVAGSLVREGTPVPPAAGGSGENWSAFDFCGVTEGGSYFFSGNTSPAGATDEFIFKDGHMLYREGDIVDGQTLSGAIEAAVMNENGDVAYIWDIKNNIQEALYINDKLVLSETGPVDLNGDGLLNDGAVLADFTGIASLALSDRDALGNVNVYFNADADTAGTTSSSDDVEGFYCVTVNLEVPIPVRLVRFSARPAADSPEVVLAWRTAEEWNHAGFLVYRSGPAGEVRLTDRLLAGDAGDHTFMDRAVEGGTTYTYTLGAVDRQGVEERMGLVQLTTPAWNTLPTRLLAASPNPFRGSSRIAFRLASPGEARLLILDASGRLVRRLVEGSLAAGDHFADWDGRSDGGALQPGGVYFYRLLAGGRALDGRVVRLSR